VLRHERIERVAASLPPLEVDDPSGDADVLVIGWGSTEGPIRAACHQLRERGKPVARVHLRHLAPLPRELPDLLRSYRRVVCPENNMGQLAMLLRARTLVDVRPYDRVTGQPFTAAELVEAVGRLGFDEAATNGEVRA
jgi:2-oxoglutarate/2-oxoacid ferredoxin oxidoreductase subunit alpha